MEHTATEELSSQSQVAIFLADLAHANQSPHTCRAYATDLAQLCAFHQWPIQTITADVLRAFFERHAHLHSATRARKQAAVVRFLTWAEQQELLDSNPMRKIDRVKLDPPPPRGVECDQIERILKAIPAECLCDRLFFRLLAETGLRVSEGLSLYVEDLDLSLDNCEPTSNAWATSTGRCCLHAPPASAFACYGTHQRRGEFADHSQAAGA